MNNLRLIRPTSELKDQYLDMLQDWKSYNEKPIPWVLNFDVNDFEQMIDRLNGYSYGMGLIGDQVEHSTYWLVNGDNRIIGAVNIRHRLNESLLQTGGNIGYGIRPSERKKGYATIILKLALEITKEMGMDKVLVTCDDWNIGSEKVILKNGGVFDKSNELEDENVVKKYWINVQ